MSWQPPPPPPRPGSGSNPQGQNPYNPNPQGRNPQGQNPQGQNPQGQNPQGQNPQGQNPQGQNPQGQNPQGQNLGNNQPQQQLDFYQILQVDRESHSTIIRYAYRYLAAMYHPDNAETGNAEKFRIITEAWKTLSDETKRQMYDMSLGAQAPRVQQTSTTQPGGQATEQPQFGRGSLPQQPKTSLTWNEIELRIAVLQILLEARRKRPQTGGATAKILMDCLGLNEITEMEFILWYLREKGLIEVGERVFMISVKGFDYLTDQLSKTQVLGGPSATEQKVDSVLKAGLPAVINK